MKQFELIITLLSDLSPGDGDSVAGLIDNDIAHQYGLPIIPAKRLKGALQHVGKELVDWGLVEQSELEKLFGAAGQAESGPIQFFDAVLYKIPWSFYREDHEELSSIEQESDKELKIEQYAPFVQLLRKEKTIHPNEWLQLFSTVRARTAIDIETNTAKSQSLRTMRVVHRGLTFKSKIVLNTSNKESERLLEMCVQGLRRLGLGSTRGLGEVACQIGPADSSPSIWNVPLPKTTQDDDELEALFRITLDQPVMIAGSQGLYHSCADWIPGSALLGAFAGVYIADHELGENAHQDETFSRIFLRDGVAFGYAYPEINGKRFAPCPAHWQREKNKNVAYALSQEKPQKNSKQAEDIVLRSIGALALLQEDDTLLLHEPEKEVRMHYSRPDNRGIGRPLGEEPTGEEKDEKIYGKRGQFFQYTALRQGQTFVGSLRGKKQDIDALLACIEKRNGKLRLGRSRTAEYGNVTMEMVADNEASSLLIEQGQPLIDKAKPFAICFTTPMLLIDQAGRPDPDPTLFLSEVQETLQVKLKLEKQFLKHTILSGYNGKWRMPKPKQTALDAGTVLIVSVMDGAVNGKELESRLWGASTGEGCGRLKAIPMASLQETKKMKVEWMQSPSSPRTQVDPTTAELAKVVALTNKIIKEREKKKQAIEGRDKALQLIKQESQLLEMGQTKLYQLYLHLTKQRAIRFLEEQENKEKFKKVIDACEGQSLSFIEAFFHTCKLEVRKAHG